MTGAAAGADLPELQDANSTAAAPMMNVRFMILPSMDTQTRAQRFIPRRLDSGFMNAHMTPDEFRKHGREVIDWIADYYERIESFPVLSKVSPGEIRATLPVDPPQQGEGFDGVLADLDRVILPGITHWQHPSFFAFFPANASGPAILRDLL